MLSKPFHKRYLSMRAKRLKDNGGHADVLSFDWEDFDNNTYLIRFGHDIGYNVGCQPLLLMGDFGVTWEPARSYPTEAFIYIKGKNPDTDARRMAKAGLRYYRKCA